MDAHYHQVMKAREGVKDGENRLYFAYSTILDREAFEEWRDEHSYQFFNLPQGKIAEAIDVELVFDFPSRWWGGRVAGLKNSPGKSIFGLLFEISAKDWPIVQHKEGAITGMCVETPVKLKVGDQTIDAVAFTTSPQRASQQGEISSKFIEAIIRGATQAQLPTAYIDSLHKIL